MKKIEQNIKQVQQRIKQAALSAGRDVQMISLVAVTKRQPLGVITQAIAAGLTDFGENQLQEALVKIHALEKYYLTWHFIGSIQSNKTQKIAENFAWVHSVDRLKIAERLSQQRPSKLAPLKICIQVNISREKSKAGVLLEQLDELILAVMKLPNLELRGLMTIPTATYDQQQQQKDFKKLAKLAQKYQLTELSMGMSNDLEAAITAGATLVRVGTAIFGMRN